MIKIDKDLKLKEFESKDKEKEGLTNEGLIEEKNNKISSNSMQNNLESIINTSIEKNKVFINLTNDFWKYILNCFHKVSTNNIKICAKLREIFVKYYNLIESDESLKNSKLRKEASEYYKNDEFAFILDKIIKNYIKKNKKLKTY